MPTLSWGVLWSASFTRLRFFGSCPWYIEGFFLEPLCACPLYFGVSSGVPVYLASIVRLWFFLPLLSWASSWVIVRLIPLSSVLQSVGAFFQMRFLQASSSSCPGFWLSPEGSVFLPSLPAFLR